MCAAGYFEYPMCYLCEYDCHNGGICANGTCLCTERFNGSHCNECATGYYKPRCTDDPVGFSVLLNETVYDIGGAHIIILGAYFNSATVINSTALICISPKAWPQRFAIAFTFDNGTNWFSSMDPNNLWSLTVDLNPYCPDSLNHCSYNGYCVLGDCFCYNEKHERRTQCTTCLDGYFSFPACFSCESDCLTHGTCINQTCICGEHFKGVRCDGCEEHYYGEDCQKIPVIFSVTPNNLNDIGDFNATVTGDNFDINASSVICQYRSQSNEVHTSNGWVIDKVTIYCWVPPMNVSTRQLFMSLDNGTNWFSPIWV
ncbi:unnamed protein product, partial [Rotaria sp. Silwood2]